VTTSTTSPGVEADAAPNVLLAAWRRWPWVVVGVAVGTAVGFLALYLARPRVYQSSAQILVVKKRSDMMAGADARMSYLEDYVATQIPLLKSERILRVAAQKVSRDRVENPTVRALAEDADPTRPGLMAYLQSHLTVARERDPNNPTGGTNVLNLQVQGANPRDCTYLLESVIDVYQKELESLYDEESERQLAEYDRLTKQYDAEKAGAEEKSKAAAAALNKITPEELPVIRVRVSKTMETLRSLAADKLELKANLDLIKSAGPDPKTRAVILAQISDPGRGQVSATTYKSEVEDPENAIKLLELQKVKDLKKYNPDHPVIQELDARIDFLRELARKSAGDAAKEKDGVPFDALAVHGQVLGFRLVRTEQQYRQLEADLDRDKQTLIDAGRLQAEKDEAALVIADRTREKDRIHVLQTRIEVTRKSGGFQASVINKPGLSGEPIAPRLSQALLLGAAGGFLFGLVLAGAAEFADKSFRSPAEIRARLGLPVVGHVPPIRVGLPVEAGADVEPEVVCAVRPKSVEAEAYRGVRTALYFSTHGRGHQVVQVTSPGQGDGKSTLAANLAVCIAQSGKRVILIDCDFRRPRQHRTFRLADPGPGFAAVITGDASLAGAAQRTDIENLWVLPCGARPANPAELLTSPAFAEAVAEAKHDYDFVILDTPPLLAVSDPSVVAPRADGVLLVLRMTGRARPQAERAREQLAQLGANVLGVVVNGAGRATDGYGYGRGAAYQYEHEYGYDGYHEDAADVPKKG
jgi:capsular exopolysaccharide synthesis family protein